MCVEGYHTCRSHLPRVQETTLSFSRTSEGPLDPSAREALDLSFLCPTEWLTILDGVGWYHLPQLAVQGA